MARALYVVLLSSIAIVLVASSAFFVASGVGQQYGMRIGSTNRARDVIAGPAKRAGIQNGDRIVVPDTPFDNFYYHNIGPNISTFGRQTFSIVTEHGGLVRHVTMTSERYPYSAMNAISATITVVVALLFIATGAILLLRAPSIVTLGFFFVTLSVATLDYDAVPWPLVIVYRIWFPLISLAGFWGAAVVATRFPKESPTKAAIVFERSVLTIGCVFAVLYLAEFYVGAFKPALASAISPYVFAVLPAIYFCTPLLCTAVFFLRLVRSKGETRQRLQWVIFGLAIFGIVQVVDYISFQWLPLQDQEVSTVADLLKLALPLSVAYAVLRYRVIDVRIVIGRSVAYGALVFVLLAFFTVFEIIGEHWVAGTHVMFAAEAGLVLLMALGSRMLLRRMEFAVSRILYKDRMSAQERLSKSALELRSAPSYTAINDKLVVEPLREFQLMSAALYIRKGDDFERERSVNWNGEMAVHIPRTDPLIETLCNQRRRVELTALIAEPVFDHSGLVAFALYGGRVAGDALDAGELRCLDELAAAAGTSYDGIKLREIEAENQMLRTEKSKLEERLTKKPRAIVYSPKQ